MICKFCDVKNILIHFILFIEMDTNFMYGIKQHFHSFQIGFCAIVMTDVKFYVR